MQLQKILKKAKRYFKKDIINYSTGKRYLKKDKKDILNRLKIFS